MSMACSGAQTPSAASMGGSGKPPHQGGTTMNIHRAGVVLAGLVLAVVGLPSPAQAGVIIHDAAPLRAAPHRVPGGRSSCWSTRTGTMPCRVLVA